MSEEQNSLDRLAEMLGGWPAYFGDAERKHGLSLLGQLRRDRVLDEAVFGQVVRYAVFRARFDRLSAEIMTAELAETERLSAAGDSGSGADAKGLGSDGGSFLSGKEQERAYCHNKLAGLERELLATPYQRAKQLGTAQTSFMDALVAAPKDEGGEGTVTPFRPMTRKGRDA